MKKTHNKKPIYCAYSARMHRSARPLVKQYLAWLQRTEKAINISFRKTPTQSGIIADTTPSQSTHLRAAAQVDRHIYQTKQRGSVSIRALVSGVMLILFALVFSMPVQAANSMRAELETAIDRHLQAAKSGDKTLFEQSMSSYAFYMFAQDAIKAGFALNKEVIQTIAGSIPDIEQLEYHAEFNHGATAALVFMAPPAAGQAKTNDITFVFVKLVKEDAQWRYHRSLRLHQPKLQDNGEPTQFDLAEIDAYASMGVTGLAIDGIVQKPPTDTVDKRADNANPISYWLEVKSYGYQATVMIDDKQRAATAEAQTAIKILLNPGGHTVSVNLSDTGTANAESHVSVTLQNASNTAINTALFEFNKNSDAQGDYHFEIQVP